MYICEYMGVNICVLETTEANRGRLTQELQLQVVNHHVDAEDRTQVLCESSTCS